MTSRHRGGGHKQRYRVVDFRRNKDGVEAKVAAVEYDPNRNCRILLLHYVDGTKSYILAPRGVKVGDRIMSGQGADIAPGTARSEEGRGGKAGVSTCRSRWSPDH